MKITEDINRIELLILIYSFVDDFIKSITQDLQYAPPTKTFNLTIAELVSLAIFRYLMGFKTWKEFYKFIKTYHQQDFPNLPKYGNFLRAMNRLSFFAYFMQQGFLNFFKKITKRRDIKFVDSTKLKVCRNKREFTHQVCKNIARKGKSSIGWFYGFKLHIICNELMQILEFTITPGNTDDREGLEMIWNDIFGMIIADAGYIGKKRQEKAFNLGKRLLTAVKANMKKMMTFMQHILLKLRQRVETVYSVLKLRLGIETTLPRSPLGYFAHYIWCILAYQFKKYCDYVFNKVPLA